MVVADWGAGMMVMEFAEFLATRRRSNNYMSKFPNRPFPTATPPFGSLLVIHMTPLIALVVSFFVGGSCICVCPTEIDAIKCKVSAGIMRN
jgi:hypothetical protein